MACASSRVTAPYYLSPSHFPAQTAAPPPAFVMPPPPPMEPEEELGAGALAMLGGDADEV